MLTVSWNDPVDVQIRRNLREEKLKELERAVMAWAETDAGTDYQTIGGTRAKQIVWNLGGSRFCVTYWVGGAEVHVVGFQLL